MLRDTFRWYLQETDIKKVADIGRKMKINVHGIQNPNKSNAQMLKKLITIQVLKPNYTEKLLKTLHKSNQELMDKLTNTGLEELKKLKKDLVDQYGLAEFVLCATMIAEFKEEEEKYAWENFIVELHQNYIVQNKKSNVKQIDKSFDIIEQLKHEILELKEQVKRTKQNTVVLENNLNAKEKTIQKLSLQITKTQTNSDNALKKLKMDLSNTKKSHENAILELVETKKLLNETIKHNSTLETSIEDSKKQINELSIKNEVYQCSLNKNVLALEAWQAKYPEEDAFSGIQKILIIGEKTKNEIISVDTVLVLKCSMELEEVEEMCNQKQFLEKYDLALVNTRKCDSKQWNYFQQHLKKFTKAIKQIYSSKQVMGKIKDFVIEFKNKSKTLEG